MKRRAYLGFVWVMIAVWILLLGLMAYGMKTVTYQKVLNLAAEFAQRTRDKIPTSEAAMLLGFIQAELNVMWNCVAWPELCDNLEAGTVVNTNGILTIDKREGQANEMGDVLAVLSADPRVTTRFKHVRFTEGNGVVYIKSVVTTDSALSVFVDWQLPVTDLLAVAAEDLAATTLPARFLLPLSQKAAGHLLRSDGMTSAGDEFLSLGQAELDRQGAQVSQPSWRNVQVRS